ncbi:DUF1499 domain-containing protein [Ketobacter sp.]|uniref:DUF1499 domain-containing protein n=1 Tax=Ketobacter sp. TaxID=2083498 RepID=UPI000F13680D|nr:DUF1499 domain-containing protein [Ketobacter sp.]RLT99260.1 MAG: DUF1499 domain-containing protein [Ketobacter sp.]
MKNTTLNQWVKSKWAMSALLMTAVVLGGCGTTYPVARGAFQDKLGNCPDKPNCISSNAEEEDREYPPIRFEGDPAAAKRKLLGVINSYPRTTITQDKDNYLRVEFETAVFGFVDDAEFLILDNRILVRSASRVGYSDLGKNRSRMKDIQAQFEPCCQ